MATTKKKSNKPKRTRKPTKTQMKQLRERLEEERGELVAQSDELEAAADVTQWRDAGFDDDAADTGTATFERERAQSLALNARRLLEQIEGALRRMDEDAYGRCERCGNYIEFARLEAIPYTTLCIEDKRREAHGY
jgi:RNA polymerase-binding protein DksA